MWWYILLSQVTKNNKKYKIKMCRFYPKWASLSHPLPVACVADFLVFFELVTHHLKELVAVGTQVLHEAHQILDGLLYYHRALEAETGERIVTERKTDTVKDMETFERTGFYAKAWSDPVCCSANMTGCLQLHVYLSPAFGLMTGAGEPVRSGNTVLVEWMIRCV